MDDAQHALLSLIVEHGLSAPLARALYDGADPRALAREGLYAVSVKAARRASRQVLVMQAHRIVMVPIWQWPTRLLIARPLAPALFVRGAASLLARRAVAIVGARNSGAPAKRWATACAEAAARAGYLVVSGGARGADRAAHDGALLAGGPTLAYLGVAADRVYPRGHRRLFEKILAEGGAVVSENPPLSTTFSSSHAMRNRLIAAHAEHVLIAEAEADSGSLGTARFAAQFHVPVWVAPSEVGGARSGIDGLLAEGVARLFPGLEHFAAGDLGAGRAG